MQNTQHVNELHCSSFHTHEKGEERSAISLFARQTYRSLQPRMLHTALRCPPLKDGASNIVNVAHSRQLVWQSGPGHFT
jgi:hypothetical protein